MPSPVRRPRWWRSWASWLDRWSSWAKVTTSPLPAMICAGLSGVVAAWVAGYMVLAPGDLALASLAYKMAGRGHKWRCGTRELPHWPRPSMAAWWDDGAVRRPAAAGVDPPDDRPGAAQAPRPRLPHPLHRLRPHGRQPPRGQPAPALQPAAHARGGAPPHSPGRWGHRADRGPQRKGGGAGPSRLGAAGGQTSRPTPPGGALP